jgi:hypothetical protein
MLVLVDVYYSFFTKSNFDNNDLKETTTETTNTGVEKDKLSTCANGDRKLSQIIIVKRSFE